MFGCNNWGVSRDGNGHNNDAEENHINDDDCLYANINDNGCYDDAEDNANINKKK